MWADQAGADHHVLLVQHGRLPGSDAERGLVEVEAKSMVGRIDPCSDRAGAVAQLGVGACDRDIQRAADVDGRAPERFARTDDDGVRARVGADRVERLGRRDPEALPLAGSEAPVPGMAAQLATLPVDDRAVGAGEPAPLEERSVVVPGEKARFLALAA